MSADGGVNLPKLTVAAEAQNDYNMIMNEGNTLKGMGLETTA